MELINSIDKYNFDEKDLFIFAYKNIECLLTKRDITFTKNDNYNDLFELYINNKLIIKTSNKLIIIYSNITRDQIHELYTLLSNDNNILLFYNKKIQINKMIENLYNLYKDIFQYITIDSMYYNITNYKYCPQYIKTNDINKIDKKDLPIINYDNPLIKYTNLNSGDIVKVIYINGDVNFKQII